MPSSSIVPSSLNQAPSFDPVAGLPARLVKRILEFEFVEIADMLPDAWQEDSQTGADTHPLSRRLVRRTPIAEITLWLEGFARLASVLTSKHPTKAAEMWAYQSAIIRAARNFEGTAWAWAYAGGGGRWVRTTPPPLSEVTFTVGFFFFVLIQIAYKSRSGTSTCTL